MTPQRGGTNCKGPETDPSGQYGHKQDTKRKAKYVVCVLVCFCAFVEKGNIWVNICELILSRRFFNISFLRYQFQILKQISTPSTILIFLQIYTGRFPRPNPG